MKHNRRIYEPLRLLKETFWGKTLLTPLARGDRTPYERYLNVVQQLPEIGDLPISDDAGGIGILAFIHSTGDNWKNKNKAETTAEAMKVSSVAAAVASFVLGGRHIVHFHEDFAKALSRSESVGLKVDDLKLPWDSFYIAFDGDDFSEGGYRLDGMVVYQDNEYLKMIPLFEQQANVPSPAMAGIVFEFGDDRGLLDVAREEVFGPTAEDIEFWKNNPVIGGLMQRNLPVFVNSLLYLSAEPDAGETRWQDGAPAKLVAKTERESKQGEKAERELQYSHWNKVRYIGTPPSPEHKKGTSPSAHWVRGHFRKQAHGKGLLQRKIIWIKPHLSGGTAEDLGEHANVRIVSDKN